VLAVLVEKDEADVSDSFLMSAAAVRMAVQAREEFAGAWEVMEPKTDGANPGVLVKHDFFRRTEFDGADDRPVSQFPAWEKCVPSVPVRRVSVSFDAKQLMKMAQAMGDDAVTLVFDAEAFDGDGCCEVGGPLVVLSKLCPAAVGVLMPRKDGPVDSDGWKRARELNGKC
jgi:hypothetical protein